MSHRDPRCVYLANSMGDAEVTAAWLTSQGLPAEPMDRMSLGGLEGLTALAPGVSSRGIEVWIENPEHAQEAAALLEEYRAALAKRKADAEARGPIEVVCPKCGKKNVFPAKDYGTVQDCKKCRAYLDVGEVENGMDEEASEMSGAEGSEDGES